MLSPHEYATLMLVTDATQQFNFDQADLLALVERKLIDLERHDAARCVPRVTDRGHALLARLYAGEASR